MHFRAAREISTAGEYTIASDAEGISKCIIATAMEFERQKIRRTSG
jgi:hypothetical protein